MAIFFCRLCHRSKISLNGKRVEDISVLLKLLEIDNSELRYTEVEAMMNNFLLIVCFKNIMVGFVSINPNYY